MAYVYILKSLKNNLYYVGSTENVDRRVKQHNSGNVASTKNKRPYKLMFYKKYANLKIAHQVELKIKKWKRKDYIEKVINNHKITIKGKGA